ncbi:MAG: AarF/ABC1/UbiB kinase family protein [Vicinamibacteraceae bacterium]|nr:AarF/ABC1/UbiB kinase family protein [Vicinamibacteraceae bacterium]
MHAAGAGARHRRGPRAPGLVRRFFTTYRHLLGLLAGSAVAWVSERRTRGELRGVAGLLQRAAAWLLRPFVDESLRDQPFHVQLRRRLELLGPTYIKLGQILSLREDILPRAVTSELGRLLDQLPPIPFDEITAIIEQSLGRPLDATFERIDPAPLGSASLGQTHRARTLTGDEVVVKILKPGVRSTLERDAVLLGLVGRILQLAFSRFQPRRMIAEFTHYTLREVDLRLEADNAEAFRANFHDQPGIAFPRIYDGLSSRDVLTMEFFDGIKPSDPRTLALPEEDRDRLIDLGAQAIMQMLYEDGFFHADLHPGNLIILPGPACGFIDLGMVGRFPEELRRALMYYYYALVTGNAEDAARYLEAMADAAPRADPAGFRREVEEVARRWLRHASFGEFSLARLMLELVSRAAKYRLYFPVEMVLMVKAIVTFEGVGHLLKPQFDVATVSRQHVRRIFLNQFSPLRVAREGLRGAPEMLDALIKAPILLTEGVRMLERTTRHPQANPLAGIRSALLAGACLVGGVIALVSEGPLWLSIGLFLLAVLLALRRA